MSEELQRKLNYLLGWGSDTGIGNIMLSWEGILEEIYLNTSINLLFQLLLDLYLNLNLQEIGEEFEWYPIDFEAQFTPEFPEFVLILGEAYEVARYDITYYGLSVYGESKEGMSLPSRDLERIAWTMRYMYVTRDVRGWVLTGKAILEQLSWYRDFLIRQGYPETYIDALLQLIAEVEGKLMYASYFGFAIFGYSKFTSKDVIGNIFKSRILEDLKTEVELETIKPYESHTDLARCDYGRTQDIEVEVKPEFVDKFVKAVKDFHDHIGLIKVNEYSTLYPRVHHLTRVEKYHWVGGKHQLRIQDVILQVKQILDRRGVISNMRMLYISFAQQLYYLKYEPHRRWKRWVKYVSEDDLIDKFKRMGADEYILREISRVVKPL